MYLQSNHQRAAHVHLSSQTVRNELHEHHIRSFAQECQKWQMNHLHTILFTDSSRFTTSTCDTRERVWRRGGER